MLARSLLLAAALFAVADALVVKMVRNRVVQSMPSMPITRTVTAMEIHRSKFQLNAGTKDYGFSSGYKRQKEQPKLTKYLEAATNMFPLWVLSFSLIGLKFPSLLSWFIPFITPALALTMTGMGMTLTAEDFQRVLRTPQYTFLGFLAQYTIMPLSAVFFSKIFQLSPSYATGLILVGSSPGGTASNLVTLIAGADVALSVTMTAVSTIAAIVMTPLLATKLCGSMVAVKSMDLLYSVLNVVLAPIFVGVALNKKFPKQCQQVSKVSPFLSVMLVAMICGSVSAQNASNFVLSSSSKLIFAVISLHASGFGFGYLLAKLFKGVGEKRARTISIETGMQNSALAVVLAKHFPSPNMVSIPGAISATTHSVLGSLLSAYWRSRPATN